LLLVEWTTPGDGETRIYVGAGPLRGLGARGGMPVALKRSRRNVSGGVRGLEGGAGSCGGVGAVWW